MGLSVARATCQVPASIVLLLSICTLMLTGVCFPGSRDSSLEIMGGGVSLEASQFGGVFPVRKLCWRREAAGLWAGLQPTGVRAHCWQWRFFCLK